MEELYCDNCRHLTGKIQIIDGKKVAVAWCAMNYWYNEPRIGPKGDTMGFIRPLECNKWEEFVKR